MSPDPRYLFVTPKIQEAWGAIEYGIRSREGIILLTGEAGTGKTSLIRRLLEWLHERQMPTAFIFNSHLESKHLYDFMLADFGVRPDPRWQGNALMCLGQWLPEQCREGRIPVLIVDEAQGLPIHVLEEIRLLLNLETPHEKLLQIVLAGQPELEEKLNRPETRQLKQRIMLRCKTAPLTPTEARDYVQARLDVAGASGRAIFSPDAVDAVHAYSRGIPRVMNLLCEHALINAYAGSLRVVPARVLDEVAREFHFDREKYVPSRYTRAADALPYRNPEGAVLFAPAISEPSPPPVQTATPQPTPAPNEPSTALPFPTSVEPTPAIAALHRAEDIQPQEPMHVMRASNDSAIGIHPSAAHQTIGGSAARLRTRKVSTNSLVFATLRDSWPKTLFSSTLRSKLMKRRYNFQRTLHHAWRDITYWRVRKIKAAVESRSETGLRWLSAKLFRVELDLQGRWRNAAPVWQRTKASLLNWFKQPLRLRHPIAQRDAQPVPIARAVSLKVESWPTANRQLTRARKQAIVLPSSEPGMNVIVLRWLRQPFRASASARSPHTATSRHQ